MDMTSSHHSSTACAELLTSIRGKTKISIDGFLYNKSRNRGDLYYWICEKTGKCRGTASTIYRNSQHIIRAHDISKHNHAPDPAREGVIKTSQKIKALAEFSDTKPSNIIRNVTVHTDKCLLPYLPNTTALKQQLLYVRKKSRPREPQSIDELDLSEEWSKTLDGKSFAHIIRKQSSNILLFTTDENLKILTNTECWIMDGTFKMVPTLFKQLYTIHGVIKDANKNKKTIPLVYALLSCKTEKIYKLLLQEILKLTNELGYSLEPKFVLTDFEIAAINATKAVFPSIVSKACFFHFCQSIYRKVQTNGLTQKYGSDVQFALLIKQMSCLAFLPDSKIPNCFNDLKSLFPTGSEIIPEWFDRNYVNGSVRQKPNGTIASYSARFSPTIWSLHDNIMNDLPRTSNFVESWHRRWQALVDNHSGLFKIITNIQKEQAVVENEIQSIRRGELIKKRRKKDRLKDERINNIICNRHNYTDIEFITCIAHNISL